MNTNQPTRDDAIAAAGQILTDARALRDSLTPREAAEAAYRPGGPSIDELENRISAMRSKQHNAA
jgi:hypothetical protein